MEKITEIKTIEIPRPLPPGAVKQVLTAVYKTGATHEECIAILEKAIEVENEAHESASAPEKLKKARAEITKLRRELKVSRAVSTICVIGSLICAGILLHVIDLYSIK